MTLTGRVVELGTGSAFADGVRRATIQIIEAGSAFHNKISVPNVDDLKLDDEVSLNLHVRVGVSAEGAIE